MPAAIRRVSKMFSRQLAAYLCQNGGEHIQNVVDLRVRAGKEGGFVLKSGLASQAHSYVFKLVYFPSDHQSSVVLEIPNTVMDCIQL